MKILAIETSCDETSAAIVEDGNKILSNVISSSLDLHSLTGGIIPEVAAREQIKYMIPVINETMNQCSLPRRQAGNLIMNNIDALAVTSGPGLNGSLLIGIETAKTIAYVLKLPIIPVNHVLAHIYANFLSIGSDLKVTKGLTLTFPALALVVSGGHTELFLMKSHEDIKWISGTLDDAAGEAFDKTARLLGLGYPGGPAIAASAAKFKISRVSGIRDAVSAHSSQTASGQNSKFKISLPRPLFEKDNIDFSFSGLKTAVLREVNKFKEMHQWNNDTIQQLSYEIQEAITDVLVKKTLIAAKRYNVKSILLGGGVAANKRLSEKFQFSILNSQFSIHVPPPSLCTDNAAYIASFAFYHKKYVSWRDIQSQPNLSVEV